MIPQAYTKSFDLGDGRMVTIETGKLARQADGAVVVRMGNTMLLATVVSTKEAREGQDFFPLSVDYQEKFAAAGKIPGSFFKREGRVTDFEILVSRLVDRALRPLFHEDYLCDTQVMISLVSHDENVMPDSFAALAASAALTCSDIPFNGPISEVRVARIEGKFVINPSREELETADMDFMVGATMKDITMVEGEAKECSEDDLLKLLLVAHDAIKVQCKVQLELAELCGKTKKREFAIHETDQELYDQIQTLKSKVMTVAKSGAPKHDRSDQFKQIIADFVAEMQTANPEISSDKIKLAKKYYHDLEYYVMREMILKDHRRLDGRGLKDVRDIWIEPDFLPAAHGSAVFTRGETQSLTTVTLGTKLDELMIDAASYQNYHKFILHYNFPAFSTGEVKPNRGPGRREVGHGNLALRSLKQILPSEDENPYTIRIVSDILESNGSSSMATVCAGSIALMDAGIKIKSHCSGVAMGLITDSTGDFAILTDILGDEDHLGDMDFKVTGTEKGICGVQMDIKIDGLSTEMMTKALSQAKEGRLHILKKMVDALPQPREDYKAHAPRMIKIFIPQDMIGAVIGPGGKIIQGIQKATGSIITIEEKNNQGEISIAAADKDSIDAALNWIKGIVAIPEPGEVYDGRVKSVMPYGAFVEFMPGKEGLLHISEVSWSRLENLDGVLAEGDMVKVKLLEVDKKTGKFKLSRKVLMPKPEKKES